MNSSANPFFFDKKYKIDDLWSQIYLEAETAIKNDQTMSGFIYSTILKHSSLSMAIINRLADRFYHHDLDQDVLRQTLTDAASQIDDFDDIVSKDLAAVFELDPACHRLMDALLYLKGFHALQSHRMAHALWLGGRVDFSYYLQSRSSSIFQTDIHPAAKIGKGIFLDHATGLVIGETAIIEDHVSILHSVTLGGTGKAGGDRHPKIRRGVLIGAGAKILGNIEIGCGSKIASGSVVLKDVPEGVTVAGVPARIIGETGCPEPSRNMDQTLIAGEGI